jgi:3'-phosphoadenosine 5'-phosphosulfate (PAPS) 3'-phosphatase
MSWKAELEAARRIAIGAGRIALEYAGARRRCRRQADDSPVTAADRASEATSRPS